MRVHVHGLRHSIIHTRLMQRRLMVDAPMPLPSPPPLPLPHHSGRRQRRRCCRRSLSLLRLTLALSHAMDVAAAAGAGRKCKPAAGAMSAGSGLGVRSDHPSTASLLASTTSASSSEMLTSTVAAGALCSCTATVLRQQVRRPPTRWMRPFAWAPHLACLLRRRRPLPPNSLHHPRQEHAKSRHGTHRSQGGRRACESPPSPPALPPFSPARPPWAAIVASGAHFWRDTQAGLEDRGRIGAVRAMVEGALRCHRHGRRSEVGVKSRRSQREAKVKPECKSE